MVQGLKDNRIAKIEPNRNRFLMIGIDNGFNRFVNSRIPKIMKRNPKPNWNPFFMNEFNMFDKNKADIINREMNPIINSKKCNIL